MSEMLTLVRHGYLPNVTLGWLAVGDFKFATLEEPWIEDPDGPGGQRSEGALPESCIPDGIYEMRPHFSAKYPDGVWCLVNPNLGVYAPGTRPAGQKWGRDAVLLHSGNDTTDTEGCILGGRRHEMEGSEHVVRESRNAIQQLRSLLGLKTTHTIQIRAIAGTCEA
jgi:hypothetical protein